MESVTRREIVVRDPCEHEICNTTRMDCFMDHDDLDCLDRRCAGGPCLCECHDRKGKARKGDE